MRLAEIPLKEALSIIRPLSGVVLYLKKLQGMPNLLLC
jgi:hypothetical protein